MAKVLLYELGRSISFGRLPLLGKVLWPMLLAASDNQGRGLAEPDVIKWTVCPNVNELVADNIPDLLEEIARQDMIHLYSDSRGRQLYQVLRWWEYQDLQWAQPSNFEPPPEWVDRVRYQRKEVQTTQNWDKVGGFLDNGGGATRPGAKDIPPGIPAGIPPGEPATDLAGLSNQNNSTQNNSTTTQLNSTDTDLLVAVVGSLSGVLDAKTVEQELIGWPHPEHAAALVAYARHQKDIKSIPAFVRSKLRAGWQPPPPDDPVAAYRLAAAKYPEVMTG